VISNNESVHVLALTCLEPDASLFGFWI